MARAFLVRLMLLLDVQWDIFNEQVPQAKPIH